MAARDNSFYIEPANPLQALMTGVQGFDRSRKLAAEDEMKAGRLEAVKTLQSGGDLREPLAKLLGIGDVKGAAVIADFAKNQSSAQGVYGTPIYGTDTESGKGGVGTFDKQGKFKLIDTGTFQPTPGVKLVDTGTGTAVIDSRSGRPVGAPYQQPQQPGQQPSQPQGQPQPTAQPPAGYIRKDVTGKAREEKVGTDQAALMNSKVKNEQSLVNLESQWKVVDDTISSAIKNIDWTKAGILGAVTSGIPGTPAYDLAKVLDTIKANIGFDKLQQMRTDSPTGGALGQVSDFENRLLQSVRGAVEQGQSPGQLRANLMRVQKDLRALQAERRKAFDQTYSGVQTISSGATGFEGQGSQNAKLPRIPAGMTPDQVRARYPSGTSIILPDGSQGTVP